MESIDKRVRYVVKKDEYGEWMAVCYIDSKKNEDYVYYSLNSSKEGKEDAIETAKLEVARYDLGLWDI